MGYVIAMAGKGGTGKTTVAALIVRLLKENKAGSILAIDADPNSNLAETLGVKSNGSIGELLDKIAASPEKIPGNMPKERFIEYQVQTLICEGEGFDLLSMGRPEGPGCYCYVNNVLRNMIGKLVKDYDFIIVDNEAGLEHLSRRTTRAADVLIMVSGPTKAGLRAIKKINLLSQELKLDIKKRLLLINRSEQKLSPEELADPALDYLGNIPQDEAIDQISLNGNSIISLKDDAVSLRALRKIQDKIWQQN